MKEHYTKRSIFGILNISKSAKTHIILLRFYLHTLMEFTRNLCMIFISLKDTLDLLLIL